MSRIKFLCLDCKIDTGKVNEFYMLKDEIWFSIHNSKEGMLCIDCLEKRLKRKLVKTDFNDSFVNKQFPNKSYSNKLLERMKQ